MAAGCVDVEAVAAHFERLLTRLEFKMMHTIRREDRDAVLLLLSVFPFVSKVDCLARMLCLLVRLVLCFKCFKVAGSLYFQISDDFVRREAGVTLLHR